ncbi:MAG: sugar phosphate nucleotidyltransferase [Flavobacteriales bacterium]
MKNIDFTIHSGATARQALERINQSGLVRFALFVMNAKNLVVGALMEGDIRRGLLAGKGIDVVVDEFMNRSFASFVYGENNSLRFEEYKKREIRFIPETDSSGKYLRCVDIELLNAYLPVDAVLMAGGRGERLKPLTDTVPKPLLKIAGKPIIEYNIDNLCKHGINTFHVSLGYLHEQIDAYLKNKIVSPLQLEVVLEKSPLGTAGSLSLMKNWVNDYILMMNCDLLTNVDFSVLYKKAISSGADVVMATIPYNVDVPYGVIKISEGEEVMELSEKPQLVYQVNAGIYLFKKDLLSLVPAGEKFDATDFLNSALKKKKKVVAQSVMGYWLDIGRPSDFERAKTDIAYIKF